MNSISKFKKFENEKRSGRTSETFHSHKSLVLTLFLKQSKLKFSIENSRARRSISVFSLFKELFQFMSRIAVVEN